jgi:hypothetical protein
VPSPARNCFPESTTTGYHLGELTSLETTLQEILSLQGQNVIELHARLVEHTDTDQTANEGIALEEALRVLLVEGEKLTAVSLLEPKA